MGVVQEEFFEKCRRVNNEHNDFINACLNLVLRFYHADAL